MHMTLQLLRKFKMMTCKRVKRNNASPKTHQDAIYFVCRDLFSERIYEEKFYDAPANKL